MKFLWKSLISFCYTLSSLFSSLLCCEDCGLNYSQQQRTTENHAVLIISSVDGNLYGLNVDNGDIIWNIKNPPLVSQSLSKLEFIKDSKKFRLIPSLEGQLYMLEIDGDNNGLRALPITADALFSSTFQLSSDSLLVGGKDQRVFGFSPFTGEVKYRCGKDGCEQDSSFQSSKERCDLLICRRISHVVRAVDLDTGHERWNFSVGQDDIVSIDKDSYPQSPLAGGGAVVNDGCVLVQDGRDTGNIRYAFNVELGEVEAIMKPPFTRVLWKRRLSSSLSRVWLMDDGVVTQLALFAGDSHGQLEQGSDESGCPRRRSLFLGLYNGHMYVQLEDGNARAAPRPKFVSLASEESPHKHIESSLNGRHRISRMTRHEITALQHGFFRPPMKDLKEPSDAWFIQHGMDEYYPPSTEPLVVRYGSFLFQKLVLGCLIIVISHLVFTNLYLPYQLRKGYQYNLACNADSPGPIHSKKSVEIEQGSIENIATNAPLENKLYESRYETDYDHVRCLGRGAFGVVFEARHRVDQYSYAVKRVRVRYSEDARARLLQEVQAFAHLEHPGIVRYYQAWFELPPQGWQEARDKELELDRDSEYDLSDDSSGVSISGDSCEGASTRCTTTSDWSKRSAQLNADPDSLIIFDHSVMSIANRQTSNSLPPLVSDTKSSLMSSLVSRSNHCSHIYLYISMHLYSSRSLKDWLQEQQVATDRLPNRSLLHIFAQIVDAVAYLHSNGLMHRDLKPSNILFDNQNHIRIVDFGLATSLLRTGKTTATVDSRADHGDGDHTSLTSNVGTELYMSPEQEKGSNYDQKVDVFALGIIFIELIVPLSTMMERVVVLSKARKMQFEAWITESFQEEIEFASRLLHHDPCKRPSCEEIFDDHILSEVVDDVRTRQRRRSVSRNL